MRLLSTELEDLIQTLYAPESWPEVRAALLDYGTDKPGGDRVQFDLLHLSEGNVARLQELAEAAKRDPRDVLSGEYFMRVGRFYPHFWARRHPVNRDRSEPPPRNTALLALAQLRCEPQTRLERSTPGGKVRRPTALFLAITDADKLLRLAEWTLALAAGDGLIDLTSSVEYRTGLTIVPTSTVIRCVSDANPEALTYETDVLSWIGDSAYWKKCSGKLIELSKNTQAAELPMILSASDQQIFIGFRPPNRRP